MSRRGLTARRRWRTLVLYGGVTPFVLFALFPFYYMVVTSLKGDPELYDLDAVPFWIGQGVTLKHYRFLLSETLFPRWFLNTLFVSVSTVLVSVVVGILAAYAIARLRFRGVSTFGVGIFITYLVPPALLFIPLAIVVTKLGLADTPWALILTYPTFLVPFNTWLLMGYFRTIPKEIEECAMIDGCNRLQALIRVVLPIALPGIICAVLFSFTFSWNEFLYALVFVSSGDNKTITVGVTTELIRGDIYFWGSLMAGGIIGALPIVVAYVFFLDYYVSGLTGGAVKG
jgi:multiple sugar transport system permease protein